MSARRKRSAPTGQPTTAPRSGRGRAQPPEGLIQATQQPELEGLAGTYVLNGRNRVVWLLLHSKLFM
jgi:hypothetical protein